MAWEMIKAVAGGMVAALITLAVNGWRLDRDLERTGRNLAIQLTDLFERYALACSAIPGQHQNSQRDNPYDYSDIATLPAAPDLPSDDAGWRALDATLAIDARTFGTRRQQSGTMINGTAEHGDADDVETEVEDQALFLGEAAWGLAVRMRDRYDLGPTHVSSDLGEHFATGLQKMTERQARRAKEAAEQWEEMERLSQVGPNDGPAGAI